MKPNSTSQFQDQAIEHLMTVGNNTKKKLPNFKKFKGLTRSADVHQETHQEHIFSLQMSPKSVGIRYPWL